MRIITLSENMVSEYSSPAIMMGEYGEWNFRLLGGRGEWGLSILVEADDHRILLDTGSYGAAVHNAELMGIDLSRVDKIVLSHGHCDHTGGLREVLRKMRKNVEIIAHPAIWSSKYFRIDNGTYAYDGIPFQREELETLGASFNLSKEPVWITENVATSGEISMVTEYEKIDPIFYVKEKDEFHPDPLLDDQALFIKDKKGLVIILGCCHRGIVNTLNHAKKLTGVEKIYAIVGGTHLAGASKERLELTISELKTSDIQKLGVSHCTGMATSMKLAQVFGDKFFFNNAGTITEI